MNHLDYTFEDIRIIATKVNNIYHTIIIDNLSQKIIRKEFSELEIACILHLILNPEIELSRTDIWRISENAVKELPLEFRMIP